MALCECLTQKGNGSKKGIMHYEGCPCFDPEYEKLCKAYRELLASYRLGSIKAPENALNIIERYTLA